MPTVLRSVLSTHRQISYSLPPPPRPYARRGGDRKSLLWRSIARLGQTPKTRHRTSYNSLLFYTERRVLVFTILFLISVQLHLSHLTQKLELKSAVQTRQKRQWKIGRNWLTILFKISIVIDPLQKLKASDVTLIENFIKKAKEASWIKLSSFRCFRTQENLILY